MKTNEEYRLLEQQNLALAAAIERKNAGLRAIISAGEDENADVWYSAMRKAVLAKEVKASPELLAKRDAALLRAMSSMGPIFQTSLVRNAIGRVPTSRN